MDRLNSFLKTPSRNMIVFLKKEIYSLETVNVGTKLSEAIYNINDYERVPIRVFSKLNDILNTAISQDEIFGSYLSIENLGVVFEPELKIDFARLLDSYSQNNVLFVKWDGEIDAENIYFLSKENGIKINIQNLSHIVI